MIASSGGLEASNTDYVIYARGADGALWGRHYTSTSGWGAWTSAGGHLLSGTGPAIANEDYPDPDVLVVGTNKELYYNIDGVGGFYAIGGLSAGGQIDESDGTWTSYPPTFTAWTPVG